jgi:predicted RNA-binding protein YlxR (DUF448 family)
MAAQKGPRPRRMPIRTCVGCRQAEGKRDMIRVVRNVEGRIAVDPTGRANGRGAYLHPSRLCWEKALRGGRIGTVLKITPETDDIEALRAFASALPMEMEEPWRQLHQQKNEESHSPPQ